MTLKKALSLLAVAVALPAAAFAADSTMLAVTGGEVTVRVGTTVTTLAPGQPIPSGAVVRTTGTFSMKLSDGSTAYFTPGSTFRLTTDAATGGITLTMTAGSVSGSFPAGAPIVVSTASGSVNVAGSTSDVGISSATPGADAVLTVSTTKGTATITTNGGASVAVAAGTQVGVGSTGAPVVSTLSVAQAGAINSAAAGNAAPAPTGSTPGALGSVNPVPTPNLAVANPDLSVVSPNGEGQNQ